MKIIRKNLFKNIELTSSCVIDGFFELAARILRFDYCCYLEKKIRFFSYIYPFEMVEHNSQQEFLIDEHILFHFQPN